MVLRLDSIDQLTQPGSLERVLGPVVRVRREPMSGASSFSGARHERVRVDLADGTTETLVLKLARPERNWIAQRTCDGLGREAALLGEPALAGVWEVFARTYLAFAQADGELGLLMVDLGEYLPPDVREPIAEAHEEALLTGLARLHARFWESPALELPWLAEAPALVRLLWPQILDDATHRDMVPSPLRERVVEGWTLARARLSPRAWGVLTRPADEWTRLFEPFPRTLIHGDSKVANFALLPTGRLAAIDWEVASSATPTVEMGWYLIVNSTRLARPRDEVLAAYRRHLEAERGAAIPESRWSPMLLLGLQAAATMLLWSKALACREARPGAEDEWAWWVDKLES